MTLQVENPLLSSTGQSFCGIYSENIELRPSHDMQSVHLELCGFFSTHNPDRHPCEVLHATFAQIAGHPGLHRNHQMNQLGTLHISKKSDTTRGVYEPKELELRPLRQTRCTRQNPRKAAKGFGFALHRITPSLCPLPLRKRVDGPLTAMQTKTVI